ncbi:MAG: PEP-CTERM sorting domain-containing protein, partial [Gammaproteobacteria bacterium]|nr:PEP-CTERM sorting domain-containing protein [Gammaproteobacteria bacterium]
FVKSGKSAELLSLPSEIDNYQITPNTETYGAGDAGTPGTAGSAKLMVSAVPVPASIWLFASGLIGFAKSAKRKRANLFKQA